ncbi:MAG: PAS domain S-box protein [Verrucomicrobiota bacterium]
MSHGKEPLAERALPALAALGRVFGDRCGEAIVLTDLEGIVVWVSPGVESLCGYRPEELIGRRPAEVFHGEEFDPAMRRRICGELAARRPVRTRVEMRGRNGRRRRVELSIEPVRDDRGEACGFLALSRELSAEEQALHEQREAMEHYETIVVQSPFAAYLIQDGRLVYTNARCAEMLGYTQAELRALPSLDPIILAEDRPLVQEAIRQRLAGEKDALICRFRAVQKDGSVIHLEAQCSRADYRGAPAIAGSALDVTREIEARRAVTESETRLRFATEAANAGVVAVDYATGLVEFCPRARQMFDLDPAAVLDEDRAWRQVHPEDRERFDAARARALDPRDPDDGLRIDHCILLPDGEMRWLALHGKVYFDGTGSTRKPRSLLGILQDVSDRQSQLHALQASEARLRRDRAAFEAIVKLQHDVACSPMQLDERMQMVCDRVCELLAADGTVVELVEGDELVYAGAAGSARNSVGLRLKLAHSFSGLSVRTRQSQLCTDAENDPRVDAAAVRKVGVRSMVVSPLLYQEECFGAIKALSVTRLKAFTEEDRKVLDLASGFLAAMISNSRRFEAERRLRLEKEAAVRSAEEAVARAEEATRVKSDFLATMSHEIRTPMNGVLGMTQILLATSLEPRQQEYVETIANSGEALLMLINDILDFSKIEAGKLTLEDVPFDLARLLDDVAELFSSAASQKGVLIHALLEKGVPLSLRGDPFRLRQVLTNLVSNAVKFTDEGEICLGVAPAMGEGKPAKLRFEVRDSGRGITPETEQALFRPFVQGDADTVRRYGGTGLGLSICRQLIELMGGEIGVESTPGAGSTFWFTLPCEPALGVNAATNHWQCLRGRRVLLAIEAADLRSAVRRYLENVGVETSFVVSGAAALQSLASGPCRIDGLLLDHALPDMSGAVVAQALRGLLGEAFPPTLLLTPAPGGDEAHVPALSGICSLPKPVRQSRLLDSLADLLGEGPSHAEEATGPAHERPVGATRRVLVVEDNKVNQRVALTLLEQLGYTADCAEHGREALEAVQAEDYGLVLMDCQMPIMDGFEATRRIRALGDAFTRLPIVALTANARPEDRDACLAHGMDAHLTKPIRKEDLRRLLEQLLPA